MTLARDFWVGVFNGRHDAGNSSFYKGFGARRGTAVMAAGLKRHISGGAPCRLPRHRTFLDCSTRLSDRAHILGCAIDRLDLSATLGDSVTVVEWGEGKVEDLTDDRLEVHLERGTGADDDVRRLIVRGFGGRWVGVDRSELAHLA